MVDERLLFSNNFDKAVNLSEMVSLEVQKSSCGGWCIKAKSKCKPDIEFDGYNTKTDAINAMKCLYKAINEKDPYAIVLEH